MMEAMEAQHSGYIGDNLPGGVTYNVHDDEPKLMINRVSSNREM